ncbi:hypothetical protein ID866_1165 [Astraeus odoratus]|nr:hypothetical protein ID866_1165 [Astraeus odoratus]
MLYLTRAFVGCPTGPLNCLVLPRATFIAYPTADAVVVLDASSLALVRVLALREVFPASQHTNAAVSCLAVDPALKIIVASVGTHIAAWSLSGVHNNIFRVHSSLILPDGDIVTALDCRSGLLAVGSQSGLSIFTLILENDLLTWSKKWSASVTIPYSVKFAPTLAYIATTSSVDTQVRVFSTASGVQTQAIAHPRPVSGLMWRYSSALRGDDPVLFTITSDSVLRIFLPVVDSPHRLQLHLAIDPFSSLTGSPRFRTGSSSKIVWLDRDIIAPVIKNLLARSTCDNEDMEMQKLREIEDEKLDLFVRVLEDGSTILSVVANIDRKPPTLLRYFTLSHSPPGTIYPPPSHLYFLPRAETTLTLVTSPPLRTFEISTVTLLSGRADSLQLCAAGSEKLSQEESKISHFVRTPAGRGVAVVRADGGETWVVTDGGTNLARVESWASADHVVVLDGGQQLEMFQSSENKKKELHEVARDPDGQELTIWDSNESEFASGLEHRRIFSAAEPINDLDWTSTPDNQSILAVGFTNHIELLCQQRKTYFDEDPGWSICWRVELGNFVPYPISDSIWLANGSFLVGAGHQMFLYSQSSREADMSTYSLFEYVARVNGPLQDYHPQMLLQCLLWGKLALVKQIIVRMAQMFRTADQFYWKPLPVEDYLQAEQTTQFDANHCKSYNLLFDATSATES